MSQFASQKIPPTVEGALRSKEEVMMVLASKKSTEDERKRAMRDLELLLASEKLAKHAEGIIAAKKKAGGQKLYSAAVKGAKQEAKKAGAAIMAPYRKPQWGTGMDSMWATSGWKFAIDPSAMDFSKGDRREGFFDEQPALSLDEHWTVKIDYNPFHDAFFLFMRKMPVDKSDKTKKPSFLSLSIFDLKQGVLEEMRRLAEEISDTPSGQEIAWLDEHNPEKEDINGPDFYNKKITISNSCKSFFLRPIREATAYGGVLKIILHNHKPSPNYDWAGPTGRMNIRTFKRLVDYIDYALQTYLPRMEQIVHQAMGSSETAEEDHEKQIVKGGYDIEELTAGKSSDNEDDSQVGGSDEDEPME